MIESDMTGLLPQTEFQEIQEAHLELLKRQERVFKSCPGENYGEPGRIKTNALILRQVLLHRAVGTFEGSVSAFKLQQSYSMILSIRGQFETTAALGYLYSKLCSLKDGYLTKEVVDEDICTQLLGSRHQTIPQAPEAKQILKLLEFADKVVSVHVLGGSSKKQHAVLSDCYQFLCEFCHPNFHSNCLALDLNKDTAEFNIRHSEPMRESELNLIRYLLISSPIFVELFDGIPQLTSNQ